MNITQKNSSELTEDEKEEMFNMYKLSYLLGGQDIWFKNKKDLFSKYPCFVTFNDNYLLVYAMFQFKKKYNKISLVCHNGSDKGKMLSIDLRYILVNTGGWILEAADKVSWLLRKKNTPIIEGYDSIVEALDIKGNPNDTIEMNDTFNYNDKSSYQYTRIYNDIKNNIIYRSRETLFGTMPCEFGDNLNCNRSCITSGGKYKLKLKRSYKNRRNKSKHKRNKRNKTNKRKTK